MLPICYICLRSDVKLRILGQLEEDQTELINFCDQMCDYNFQDFFYQFCATCINKLKKCLQFKNQCKLANEIITLWKETVDSKRVSINELFKEMPSLQSGLSLSNRKNFKVYQISESNKNSTEISNSHPHILTINITKDNIEDTHIKQEIPLENTYKDEKITFNNEKNVTSNINYVQEIMKIEFDGENGVLSDELKCSSDTGLKGDSSDEEIIKNRKKLNNIDKHKDVKEKLNRKREVRCKEKKLNRKRRNEIKLNNKDSSESDSETLDKLKRKLNKKDKAKKRLQLEIITEDEFKVILKDKLEKSGVFKDDKGNEINIDNITNSLDKLPYYYLKTVEEILTAGSGPLESSLIQKILEMHGHLKIFDIEYLATPAQIEAEFSKRSQYPDYLNSEHRCEECVTGFFNQKILDFHRRVKHDPSLPLSCELCKMRFKNRRYLVLHRTQLHTVVYRCKKCPYIVNHRIGMENHYRKHEGLKYTCEHCPGTKFTRSNQLYIHMNRYHSENRGAPMYCEYCKFTTYNASGLQLHKKRAHGADKQIKIENTKKCEQCSVIFVSEDVYNKHMESKHKNRISYETLQLKGYTPRARETKRSGGKRRLVTCQLFKDKIQVPRDYFREDVYKKHMESKHKNRVSYETLQLKGYTPRARETKRSGGKRRLVTCQLCQAQGTNPLWLTNHVRDEHSNENMEDAFRTNKKYLCDECGKRFPDIIKLGDHMNTHSGARPYSCPQCRKSFHSRHNMYTHVRRHLPPVPCDECGKEFRSRANLYSHKLTHKGDKCYKCDLCGKGFITRILLNEHVRGVHLNIRRKRKRVAPSVDTLD